MLLSNVTVDVTITRRSFMFGQSRVKVSLGFTNVSSLAVEAFDLVYCSLSVLQFVFVLDLDIERWLSVCAQQVYFKVVEYVRWFQWCL